MTGYPRLSRPRARGGQRELGRPQLGGGGAILGAAGREPPPWSAELMTIILN
jgi:hypothetical protein